MNLDLILFPEAEEETHEAVAWYEQEQAGLGLEFLAELDHLFARIANAPRQFPAWELNPQFRKAVVSRFPYVVFFQERGGEGVEAVAIAHGRRKPGYWQHRRRPS